MTERRAPRWLRPVNRLNHALLARGIGPGGQYLLTIPGRTTGIPRTTPIAVLDLDGERFVIAGFPGADWVRNARKAGSARLRRGRHDERIVLEEVPAGQRRPILREFARRVRDGRAFLTSAEHPVFRVRSAP